jgi:hypothetical protein
VLCAPRSRPWRRSIRPATILSASNRLRRDVGKTKLESTAFNSPSSATYCQDIADAAGRVTLYYSVHDDVLPDAELPDFDGYPELGIYGPGYDACLLAKVVGVGCSAVVNEANARKYESGQPRILIHTSYFFILETLNDIGLTLLGATIDEMTDRLPIAGSTTGFMMRRQAQGGGSEARSRAANASSSPMSFDRGEEGAP